MIVAAWTLIGQPSRHEVKRILDLGESVSAWITLAFIFGIFAAATHDNKVVFAICAVVATFSAGETLIRVVRACWREVRHWL
jgi:hypothetical protein